MEKQCCKCGKIKNADEFYKRKNKSGNIVPRSKCIECFLDLNKIQKEKYRSNPENKKKENQRDREYYKQKKAKGYKRIRTDKYIEWERQYNKKRYLTPKGLIEHRLRARISSLIRNANLRKGRRSLEYLGCTSDEFLRYLESLFLENMSWENKDKWHIDHIIPCCSFDLTKEEEILKCFHYTNMRPLWSQDNIAKKDQDIKIKYNGQKES